MKDNYKANSKLFRRLGDEAQSIAMLDIANKGSRRGNTWAPVEVASDDGAHGKSGGGPARREKRKLGNAELWRRLWWAGSRVLRTAIFC